MTRPSAEETLDWMHVSEVLEGRLNIKVLPNGRKAIVVREAGEIRVFDEVCPHLGADMAEATYCAKDRTLQCRWHGYLFSTVDGRMTDNPNERFMQLLRQPSKHFNPERKPRYLLAQLPWVLFDDRIYFLRSRARDDVSQSADGAQERDGAAR
ncbi:MAG: Rieske (2Fe-2S) protein [Polyangiaceae bacterium]